MGGDGESDEEVYIMTDEQRVWLRSRRKRHLRTLAVILSLCVLFTSSPHIWETVSVFAAEESEGEGRQYISGFAALSEEVREQFVPLGTGLQELSLPNALEAYISEEDAENAGGGVDTPGDLEDGNSAAKETDDEGRESEAGGAVSGENESDGGEQEPGGGSREEEPDGETTDGDKQSDNGDHSAEEESDGGGDSGETVSDGGENGVNVTGEPRGNNENGSDDTEQNEIGNADHAESDEAELKQETYTVTMPEYQAENAGTAEVKTLIGGVTWDSTPAYDADTAGTYTFTAALPEGYTLAEGIALPQIAVTIREAEDAARNCGWHFGEEYVFPEGELFCEDGDYSLVLAGGDSGVQIPFEEITSYLPAEVILEYSSPETGSIQEEAVPIIGWNCPEYVEDEEGNLPYNGSFFLQAHLSKNGGEGAYGDIEGAGQIGVTLVFDAPMTMAADHTCNGITFSAWENDTRLPNAAGNYYLTKDVTVTGVWTINADIKLCLNGSQISCSSTDKFCVNIGSGGSLSVYDCRNSGKLKLINNYTENMSAATGVFVNSGGTFSLYSGLITAETDVQNDRFFNALYSNGKIYLYDGSMTATASKASAIAVNSRGEGHIYGGIYTAKGKEDGTDYGLLTSDSTYLAGSPSFSPASVLRTQRGLVVAKEGSNTYTGSKLTVFVDSPYTGYVVGGLDAGTKPKFEVTPLNENYKVIQYPMINGVEYIIVEGANTVSYDANGGTGEMVPQTFYKYGDDAQLTTAALQKNVFTKSGYAFGGWNTKPDGTGKAYADQADFTGQLLWESSTTLYAQWTANTYTIVYSGLDGATLSTRPTTHTYGTATEVGDPEKMGYTFAGWKVNGGTAVTKGLILGETEYTADITLTATWTPNVYTAAFDYQSATGGNTIENKTVTYGSTYGDLPAPARTGYTFKGWFTAADEKGIQVTAETTVTATDNHTLYAHWTDETAPDAPALQAGVTLPADWTKRQTTIPLTLYDSVGVTKLLVSIDAGKYMEVEDFTGNAGTTAYAYTVSEGEHTYQFKAEDAAGNASPESGTFTVMLDTTNPAFGDLTYENKAASLWQWIIGKKSMVIHVPVTDNDNSGNAGSGVREITYTMTPAGGSAQEPKTAAVQKGEAKITFAEDFKGDISIACTDAAGNAASSVTVSTAGSGGVIVEDTAPTVTLALPGTPQPNDRGWYLETFDIAVTVTDDKDNSDTDVISGGIAEIKWKDGENGTEQPVPGLPGTSPVYTKEFTISVNTDGAHTYYVKAIDNAGNESGWQTVTVKCDTRRPVFTEAPAASNHTQAGADITFIPSEGGKAYWLVNPERMPGAQEVVEKGAQNNCVIEDMAGGSPSGFTVTGLTPGESHTVYVVLEDAAGNLSEVKAVSFGTLQKAPEISLGNLVIDREKETVKIPGGIGEVEVYTNPENPSGSKIQPGADGSLPVEPGMTIYIRYPEKMQGSETTPASDSVEISIPGRPAAPLQKQVTVTDGTVTVVNPVDGEEYILVPKGSVPAGQEPDWSGAEETGAFTGLDPNQEYELWVRKKATGKDFASESSKTEVRTSVTVKEPVIAGEGAGKPDNTAPKPAVPGGDGGTVAFTGTYGEEYIPVIKVGDREINPEITWDEHAGKGVWEYPHPISEDEDKIEITVEFRKRTITAIKVTPESLKIHADHAANRSAAENGNTAPLTAWLEEECIPKAAYDNKTESAVQGAVYTTTDQLAPKGSVYEYTVSAEGKSTGLTLTVAPVNAEITTPSKVTQMQKSGGYTQAEVAAWLPAQITVTYTGTGYTAKTESRAVTWNTAAIDAGFGGTVGEETVGGTVDLPDWATGQKDVSIGIAFVDKYILTDAQMNLAISGWTYGAQEKPAPGGSVSVTDMNPVIIYLYSADNGISWTEADQLPKSGSGHIVPGAYQVKMTYTGDSYMGTKTAAFTVEKRTLTVEKGTLEAEDKNYDGTPAAALKEGGEPTLSGVLTGDTVTVDETLRAEFAEAGPKKNIAVTVTGFALKGRDAGYYVIGNTSITLRATINKADGTPPSDGKKPGGGDKDKDEDKGTDGNDGGGNSGNGNGTGNGSNLPVPVVSPKKPVNVPGASSLTETEQSTPKRQKPGTDDSADRGTGTQPERGQTEEPKKQGNRKNQNAAADSEKQGGQEHSCNGKWQAVRQQNGKERDCGSRSGQNCYIRRKGAYGQCGGNGAGEHGDGGRRRGSLCYGSVRG